MEIVAGDSGGVDTVADCPRGGDEERFGEHVGRGVKQMFLLEVMWGDYRVYLPV